jgi:hypothetical protein
MVRVNLVSFSLARAKASVLASPFGLTQKGMLLQNPGAQKTLTGRLCPHLSNWGEVLAGLGENAVAGLVAGPFLQGRCSRP